MALYVGLPPAEALAKWYAIRKKANLNPVDGSWDRSRLTAEENADIAGNMVGLSEQNPEAWKLVRTGAADTQGNSDYFMAFNPSTGQWDRKEHKGFWSHPESWGLLAAGGALGGIGVAGALGGAAAAPAAASAASTAAPIAGVGGGALVGGIPTTAGLAGGIGVGSTAIPSGVVAGAGAGAGAGIGSKSLWSWLGPDLIGGGLQIAGGVMGASAAKDAAEIQARATEKALALQKEMFDAEQAKDQERFDIHRADLAPYRALGAGATGRLGNLWGFDPQPPGVAKAQSGIGTVLGKVMQPTATQTAQTAPPSASAAVGAAMGTGPQVGDVRTINGQQGRWDGQGWEAI